MPKNKLKIANFSYLSKISFKTFYFLFRLAMSNWANVIYFFSSAAKKRRAFTLLEAMVSVSILSVATLVLIAVLSNIMSKMTHARQRLIAANLAQEGLEIVRNMRDANWLASSPKQSDCVFGSQGGTTTEWCDKIFSSSDNTYIVQHDTALADFSPNSIDDQSTILKFDSTTGLYSHTAGTNTPFRRLITAQLVSASHIRVQSYVKWTSGTLTFDVLAEDNLYNWR